MKPIDPRHLLGGLLAVLLDSAAGEAATFLVNSGAGTNDGVCNAANCTLPEALGAANATPGNDTINFNVPGGVINLTSAPPIITDTVDINGASQPGYAGAPVLRINGAVAGLYSPFRVQAGSTRIYGLDITNFTIGVRLEGGTGSLVENNRIGTNLAGTAQAGVPYPLVISASNNNTIRNNIFAGATTLVDIENATGNVLTGNFLNLNPTGTAKIGNTVTGLFLSNASNNTIGGTGVGERNLIAGCTNYAVYVDGSGNAFINNDIGTNGSGTVAIGSATALRINTGTGNHVGGLAAGQGNLIDASTFDGVQLAGAGGNFVQGNKIGLGSTGGAFGNLRFGVFLTSPNNRIEKNEIANNGKGIVTPPGGPGGNEFVQNSIHDNAGLGIDIGDDGPTASGITDLDVIRVGANSTFVGGKYHGAANTEVMIDVYDNITCDLSGFGEGHFYAGTILATTNASGDAFFSDYLPFNATAGHSFTATAKPLGIHTTTEFSQCRTVIVGGTPTPTRTATVVVTPTPAVTLTPSVIPTQGPPTAFHTVPPCRAVNTRVADAPALNGGESRSFVIVGKCGIPAGAAAVSFNVTVTQPTFAGDLRLYSGGTLPLVSTINFGPGQTRANNALATLSDDGELFIRCDMPAGNTVQVLLDVNGYFQ